MSEHSALVVWSRGEEVFVDNKYSRAHRWRFDGGAEVRASSSPSVVRPPFSDPTGVDPEEAFVASIASCHMLWFLFFAAQQKLVVDSYEDNALGMLAKNAAGKMAFQRVTLRPRITWRGQSPSAEALDALHHKAHDNCFIASSVTCDVVIEAP